MQFTIYVDCVIYKKMGMLVCKAKDNDDNLYAVKIIHQDQYYALNQFNIMNKILLLQHPNIIKCFAIKRVKQQLLYFLEYVPKNLREFIKMNREKEILTIFQIIQQLIIALKYLKQEGIIHRDLKPENILYSQEKKFIIADFGISKEVHTSNVFMTAEFNMRYYSAPELKTLLSSINRKYIEETKQQAFKIDVYSLGIIFMQLLFKSNDQFLGMVKKLNKKDDQLKQPLNKYWELIMKMTRQKPEDRFCLEDVVQYMNQKQWIKLKSCVKLNGLRFWQSEQTTMLKTELYKQQYQLLQIFDLTIQIFKHLEDFQTFKKMIHVCLYCLLSYCKIKKIYQTVKNMPQMDKLQVFKGKFQKIYQELDKGFQEEENLVFDQFKLRDLIGGDLKKLYYQQKLSAKNQNIFEMGLLIIKIFSGTNQIIQVDKEIYRLKKIFL